MIEILTGLFFGLGVFFIACDLLSIPHLKTSKAIANLSKRQRNKTSFIQLWQKDFALWVSKRIKINEYKRIQLLSDLQTANVNISPELHMANAIIKAGFCALLIIPAYFIFPLLTPLIAALALAVYFKEYKGISEKIKAKRMEIEYELPRFVFTIDKTLSHSRDVLAMLDTYRETAGDELKHELLITVADMRSGNFESALTRLESRVGSSMLSDVVRGLIGILRGDDTTAYWSALSIKFADIQRQILRKQAAKVPAKVRRLSMILLFCFMAMYFVVLIVEIMTSMGALFK